MEITRQRFVNASVFFIVAIHLIAVFSAEVSAQQANPSGWHQWRGPQRDGKTTGTNWGDSFDGENLKQVWRTPLGPSYSGPLIVGDRIYTTETRDKQQEVVRALARSNGQQIWESSWDGAMNVPFFARANGDWIRATPAYDDGRLYVAGMRDVLVCLDAEDGAQIWKVDFAAITGTKVPSFGLVCSPMVVGEHVYIQAGGGFSKLNKVSGEVIWQVLGDKGGMMGGAFSSPVLAEIAGVEQFVVQTRSELCGVSSADGKVLWRQTVPAFRGMNILTPTVSGDTIFTSTYKGKSYLYQVDATERGFAIGELWQNRAAGYMSSPLLIDGHVYLHLQNQRFTCIELASGKKKWTSEAFGKYWSLIADGGRILALDERGDLLLIRANPQKFELLSQRHISDESTWAHVAAEGNEIFVRELGALTLLRTGR